MKPAMPADSTTTVRLVMGLGLSRTLGPVIFLVADARKVGSGTFNIADKHDLVHVSIVLSRIP